LMTIPGNSYMLMDVTTGAASFWSQDALSGTTLGIAGLGNGTWYHVVFERTGDNSATGYTAYLNGVVKNTASSTSWSSSAAMMLGSRQDVTTQALNGALNEVRVSNVARSAGWIATEYNNQNSPSSFYTATLGQATGGGTPVSVPNVVGQTQSA